MQKVKPITPDEVQSEKDITIPDEIIQAFNCLIVKHWNYSSKCAIISQSDALTEAFKLFEANGKEFSLQDVFDNRWMDVENLFKTAGWDVEYDKPSYDESYPATFKFSKVTLR